MTTARDDFSAVSQPAAQTLVACACCRVQTLRVVSLTLMPLPEQVLVSALASVLASVLLVLVPLRVQWHSSFQPYCHQRCQLRSHHCCQHRFQRSSCSHRRLLHLLAPSVLPT